MTISFIILAALTIVGAAAAIGLRNLVHCVLALAICFVGLAILYLQLDAQFVGFAQILVYVGAVAILAVFTIMLTRSAEPTTQPVFSSSWIAGGVVAAAVFAVLAWAIHSSMALSRISPPQPQVTVKHIGDAFMHQFVLPLEIVGLLLTAALIGAVMVALHEKQEMK